MSKLSSLFFVDINKNKVLIFNTKTDRKKIIKVNKEICFLSHIKKNIFKLGLQGELIIVNLKNKKKIKSIASDFIKNNIRCNAIAPGTVHTPSWEGRVQAAKDPVKAKKDFIARQPMGRLGTPEEIAALAVYLASDESDFVTGIVHAIDGGMSI